MGHSKVQLDHSRCAHGYGLKKPAVCSSPCLPVPATPQVGTKMEVKECAQGFRAASATSHPAAKTFPTVLPAVAGSVSTAEDAHG